MSRGARGFFVAIVSGPIRYNIGGVARFNAARRVPRWATSPELRKNPFTFKAIIVFECKNVSGILQQVSSRADFLKP
jgi:hypothetical protein